MAEEKSKERRISKRYRVQASVEVIVSSIGSSRQFRFRTGNISKGGLYIITAPTNPFSESSILEVTLYLRDENPDIPQGQVTFMARVIHMNAKEGFGCKISQIDNAEQSALDVFIEAFAKTYPAREVFED